MSVVCVEGAGCLLVGMGMSKWTKLLSEATRSTQALFFHARVWAEVVLGGEWAMSGSR